MGEGQGAREGQDEKRDRRAEKEVRGNMGGLAEEGRRGSPAGKRGRDTSRSWNESNFCGLGWWGKRSWGRQAPGCGDDVASMVNNYQFGWICLQLSNPHTAGQSEYSGSGCVLKPACSFLG